MKRTLTINFEIEEEELFKIYTQAEDLYYAMHDFEQTLRRKRKDCDDDISCKVYDEIITLFFECKETYQ